VKRHKAKPDRRTGSERISVTRREGETWRDAVARMVGELDSRNVESALESFDWEANSSTSKGSHEYAALVACANLLAFDHEELEP
jgi:hypothetical protein